MEEVVVKRAKYGDDIKLEDLSECDSTYELEVDPLLLPDIQLSTTVSENSIPTHRSLTGESDDCAPKVLPDVPYQPDDVPPYRDRRRPHLFQKKWYQAYPWLHFDVASQSMFCFQCLSAINRKVVLCPLQNIFARGGFKNWKKGTERFRVHENTPLHRATSSFSVRRLLGLKGKCLGVEYIMSSVNYLLGVGYDLHQPNLSELIQLRRSDMQSMDDNLAQILFTPNDERVLLSLMTASTMRAVSAQIKQCGSYSLILEKVKVHGEMMFAAIARTSRQAKSEEFYLGLYTEQNILLELVNYLDSMDLRLYCCDMVDSKPIAESLEKIQPSVISVHCPNHNICLDLQEFLQTSFPAGRTLVVLNELRGSLENSSYFNDEYSDNQTPLCSNRKMTTFKTINTILSNYTYVLNDLKMFITKNPASFSAPFLLTELRQHTTLANLLMFKNVLYPIENLNSLIDNTQSVKEVKEATDAVLNILESLKGDDELETFWLKFVTVCESLISAGVEKPDTSEEFKKAQRNNYIATIGVIDDFIRSKICESSYDKLQLLESSLLRSDDRILEDEVTALKELNINPDSLQMEKRMLKLMGEWSELSVLPQIVYQVRDMKAGNLALVPELVKSVELLTLAQVVRCGDGRSPRLKNLKKFLELSRHAEQINELSLLYVYKDEPFMIAREVAQQYIQFDSERLNPSYQ